MDGVLEYGKLVMAIDQLKMIKAFGVHPHMIAARIAI